MEKEALHQHERGKERLNLSPASVDALQKAIDKMWFSGGHRKLPGDYYHIHIRDPKRNLLGYAALKRINDKGKRPRLILASILHPHMKPRGTNISTFVDTTIKDNNSDINIPDKFKGFGQIPNNI